MLKEDDNIFIEQKLKGKNKLTVEQLNSFTNIDQNIQKLTDGKVDNAYIK